jgi:hypothetical protein
MLEAIAINMSYGQALKGVDEDLKTLTESTKIYGDVSERVFPRVRDYGYGVSESMKKAAQEMENLRNTFKDIGLQFAAQFTGVSGAMAGFQAAGPWGAVAGAAMQLLLSNEKMREAIETVNAALAEAFAPVAEAIAPALKELTPVIIELRPVFQLIATVLAAHLRPAVLVLREMVEPVKEIGRWAERLTRALLRLGDYINDLAKKLENFWKKDVGDVFGFQHGGFVGANQLALVGEGGPELFIPGASGYIAPLGRGTSASWRPAPAPTVIQYISGPNPREIAEYVRQAIATMRYRGR